MKRPDTAARFTKHGHAKRGPTGSPSPEYSSWLSMIQRCENPRQQRFPDYGGRGITICARWRSSFEAFLCDMGARPADTTLDRRDNDGNYEPSNCRWATREEQAANRQVTTRLTLNGETLHLAEWARRLGIAPQTLCNRLSSGWPVERALTERSARE